MIPRTSDNNQGNRDFLFSPPGQEISGGFSGLTDFEELFSKGSTSFSFPQNRIVNFENFPMIILNKI